GGRAGDLSGINVDPMDGTFWAANEYANTEPSANWGTAIAHFAFLSTATHVTSSTPGSTYGQALTFTATVAPAGAGDPIPTGTIQFQIDGANFGSAVALINGSATSGEIATLPAGSHTIAAGYSGDSHYAAQIGSFLQTVTQAHLTVTADP